MQIECYSAMRVPLTMRLSHPSIRVWLRLSTRSIAGWLGGLALAAALVQLALKTKLGMLLLALFGVATGLLGFAWPGALNLGAWWALFYAQKKASCPLAWAYITSSIPRANSQ